MPGVFDLRAILWLFVIWTLVGTEHARADVKAHSMETTNTQTSIYIYGHITRADVATVAAAIRRSVPKPNLPYELMIFLNSGGGDVEAAMAIGRLIRTKTAIVNVSFPLPPSELKESAVCASACVLVLVAGSLRIVESSVQRIGIHRPYSIPSVGPARDTRAAYAALAARVKSYLDEMAMPSRLYDEMMHVPPEQIRWLSTKELYDLGIEGTDAAYADSQDSREASTRGISKQEWLRRKVLTHKFCDQFIVNFDPSFNAVDNLGNCIQHVQDTGQP